MRFHGALPGTLHMVHVHLADKCEIALLWMRSRLEKLTTPVFQNIFWINCLRIKNDELPVCASNLLTISKNAVILTLNTVCRQRIWIWSSFVAIFHTTSKNSAQQHCETTILFFRVFICLCDGFCQV